MGVEIITTVLVAAASYDLTDLATVKDELSLSATDTSKDAFLGRGITQVSTLIANACNRVFPVEAVEDLCYIQQDPYPYQVPGGVAPLQLTRWPLVNASVISFTADAAGTNTLSNVSAFTGLSVGMLVFGDDVPDGTTISAMDTNAKTITLDSTVIPAGTSLAFTAGLKVWQETTLGTWTELVPGTDYTTDAANGRLIFLNPFTGVAEKWPALPTKVQYRGGYATIPADLVDATLRLVTARNSARGRDPMLRSLEQPGVGTQQFWVGPMPGQKGAYPAEIESIVANYRTPVVA